MKAAIFLDRDGTIIEHVHHLHRPEDVALIPGVGHAIRRLREFGYAVVMVTNQSVVGRGLLTPSRLSDIHAIVLERLSEYGADLDAIYYCPHVPSQDNPLTIEHPDRKPAPGMLRRAARELSLDLSRSWMIGDSLSDTLAGRHAGCFQSVLVRTGAGDRQDTMHESVDYVASDLAEAASVILQSCPPPSKGHARIAAQVSP